MYARNRHLRRRPDHFTLKETHPLYKGLVFAGLGCAPHGTTHYRDSSPQRNHGTLTNMVPSQDWVYAPELGRRALDFDGSNDYVLGSNGAGIAFGGTGATLSGWVRPTTIVQQIPLSLGQGTNQRAYIGCLQAGLKWSIGIQASIMSDDPGGVPATLVWTHLACRWDQNAMSAALRVNNAVTVTKAFTAYSSASNLVVGAHDTGVYGNYAYGQIADVLIHLRPLSPAEIAILANRGDPSLDGFVVPDRRRVTFAPMGTNRRRRLLLAGTPQ